MGKVTRLRPKRHDVIIDGLQLVLDFSDHFGFSQATKDEISEAVSHIAPPEKWGYVMLNPTQQRLVLKKIKECPRPFHTMVVWHAVISYIAYDRDGEIMANRETLAEAAGLDPDNTTRALSQLVEIGALVRIGRGRYAINPHVGWSGSLTKRDKAAQVVSPVSEGAGPLLRLMEGGKE